MRLTPTAHLLYDALLTLAYPQGCSICGLSVERRALGVACESCWSSTAIFTAEEIVCWKCGRLSPGTVAPVVRADVRCHRCDEQPFSAARACGLYEGALRESVLAVKRRPHLARRPVTLLEAWCKCDPLNLSTRIIPVPLHPKRERARGFNQAAVIGRAISRAVRLPLDEVSLVRLASSEKYRAGLDARARLETVVNAFYVRYPQLVAGENVLLVDDVFTTGATVSVCAEVLLAAGAKNVFVITIARSPW